MGSHRVEMSEREIVKRRDDRRDDRGDRREDRRDRR